MADQASASIHISAAKAAVMAVIADFESYPAWTGDFTKVEVLQPGTDGRADRVRFHLDAGVIKDVYVLAYDWSGDDAISWHLVEGKLLKANNGSYTLAEADGGTEVTYQLEVELAMRMPGMFKRKAEKVIMDKALKGLKRRVES